MWFIPFRPESGPFRPLLMNLHKSWSPGSIEFCWNGTPPCNFFQETDLKHGISFSSAYNWTSKESEGSILKSFPVTKSYTQSHVYHMFKNMLSIILYNKFSKLSIIYLVMGRIDINCDMSIDIKMLITNIYDRLFRTKVRTVQTSPRQRPSLDFKMPRIFKSTDLGISLNSQPFFKFIFLF